VASLNKIVIGDVEMNFGTREVFCQNKKVDMTGLEFNLLWLLMNSAPQIVSRECIAMSIFNRVLAESNRSINMHISTIRKKLFAQTLHPSINTIRGEGYVFLAR
jgi:two-component system response regulator CpxR